MIRTTHGEHTVIRERDHPSALRARTEGLVSRGPSSPPPEAPGTGWRWERR